MQAFTPRIRTASPVESEHLLLQSTTLHYLVDSNKVCEKSLSKKRLKENRVFFKPLSMIEIYLFCSL
jgi:hypothetical protein